MIKSARWLDTLTLIFSVAVIGASAIWLLNSGFFTALTTDDRLTWHLIRAAGIIAYVLLAVSMVWGLFVSTQFVKNWSPGPLSVTMHSTISWLALILGGVHAALLLLDTYFQFSLGDILIPFQGPYRPLFVGLGTLAFWGLIIVTLSFPLRKRIGFKTWRRIHLLSYLTFAMVTLHGLTAGTDGERLGVRILMSLGVVAVVGLLALRLRKSGQSEPAVVRQVMQQS
ncbi:MAG: ferric reductase-like transmembrane domain-containing protein [Anaerolineae bacterium]|nr:ferric reductase-like transmembrane domain-containing protein [Anaerolineae bacterium]